MREKDYKKNIYPHQMRALDFAVARFRSDEEIRALIFGGSIAHGYNTEKSDLDFNVVVSNELHKKRMTANTIAFTEDLSQFYEGGYIDAKYITLDYLRLVIERGNEPTRFALHDAVVMFDDTGEVSGLIEQIKRYPKEKKTENSLRFLSQFEGWKWFCSEAIAKENHYLLDLAVSRLILFGGRLILLHNEIFFPYHKWFIRTLGDANEKPDGIMEVIDELLKNKTAENIKKYFDMVRHYKDWTFGKSYKTWTGLFVKDVELIWMTQDENIDNL